MDGLPPGTEGDVLIQVDFLCVHVSHASETLGRGRTARRSDNFTSHTSMFQHE